MRFTILSVILGLVLPQAISQTAIAKTIPLNCEALDMSRAELQNWRAQKFETPDSDRTARILTDCLANPDPFYRDQIGYEGLTHLLRQGAVDDMTKRFMLTHLQNRLTPNTTDGYDGAFAALVLSEVARTDRIDAYLTEAELNNLATSASRYLSETTDYRAFDEEIGWRHAVPHAADLILQLSLNPRISRESLLLMQGAIASKIAPSDYAYVHGEGKRLARATQFMMQREEITGEEWQAWLDSIGDPAPLAQWGDAFMASDDLTRLHNTRAFALNLYLRVTQSETPAFTAYKDDITQLMLSLP